MAALLAASLAGSSAPLAGQTYDIVLRGGRVMDPESGLDAVRDVGIRGDRIAAVAEGPLEGRRVVDVSGLVVAPGFIDLHAHGQDPVSRDLQVRDGVTTALELEAGVWPVDSWYAAREGKWRINFGASVSHARIRREVMGSDAAEEAAPSFADVRYAGMKEPESGITAAQEMIADAAATGGAVHIVHIGSSGLQQVPVLLDLIAGARDRGVDVSTEVYPYTAASTGIESAVFDAGWRERLGADYGDIEWVATGERLDSVTFEEKRALGGPIIAHIIPEAAVEYALAHPLVMVASDGVPFINGRAHPRGAGTFARVLGRYARELGLLPLMEALRKMTLLPARRLEGVVPEMRLRGRVAVGAYADLTVFDPETVLDRATFAEPAVPSQGIPYVLVNGTFVVREGELGACPSHAAGRVGDATAPGRRRRLEGIAQATSRGANDGDGAVPPQPT
ncbi:MAG: amidohydrolase family protein, partial [Gemmatimonadota bacterium]